MHTHLYKRKTYVYDHFRRQSWQILKIDRIITNDSLLTDTPPTTENAILFNPKKFALGSNPQYEALIRLYRSFFLPHFDDASPKISNLGSQNSPDLTRCESQLTTTGTHVR